MKKSKYTKIRFSNAFKELVSEKGIQSISVQEICEKCEMNRNTFYYHFLDKYDLVRWIYRYDIIRPLSEISPEKHWADGTLLILNEIHKNKAFYSKIVEMEGQNNFTESLFEETIRNFDLIIDRNLKEELIDERSRQFISRFYAYGFTHMTVDWIKEGMHEPPKTLMQRLIDVTDGGLSHAIKRAFIGQPWKTL